MANVTPIVPTIAAQDAITKALADADPHRYGDNRNLLDDHRNSEIQRITDEHQSELDYLESPPDRRGLDNRETLPDNGEITREYSVGNCPDKVVVVVTLYREGERSQSTMYAVQERDS
jgi:hypothetical protein